MSFGKIVKNILVPLMNKKKSYKPEGKNFLSIVKGLLEKDYEGCKKLEKEDEFELKTIPKEV